MYRYIIILLIFGVGFSHKMNLKAAETTTKVGTSAANFMKIEVGARASALGGAFVSVANDLTSMYWNPSGLCSVDRLAVQFEHLQLYAGITHNFGALAFPLDENTMVGLSAIYLMSGDIEITTEDKWQGTGSYYDATSMSLGVTLARKLTERVDAGVSVKYLRESIWRSSAQSIAVDFGFMVITGIYGLNLGMSLTNVGAPMQMTGIDMQFEKEPAYTGLRQPDAQNLTEKWPLPTTFKVGLSKFLMGRDSDLFKSDLHTLFAAVDILNSIDSDIKSNIGLEYTFDNNYSLRTGYRIGYDNVTFSIGGGVKVSGGNLGNISLDYSYTDFGVLEGLHRFSILMFP